MRRVHLPCGCAAVVEHDKGDRAITCPGGGWSMPEGSRSVSAMRECDGGRVYVITAVPDVRYVVHERTSA